jgi:ATP-dependent RNA helicase RhlE
LKDPLHIQVTPRNTTVQRITQLIHPVGRGKKKALLAHIIQEHNWSQVLVFTRTKFGANSVAEFLEKNGISAMALHGNKSQTARTQALAGFKSGDVRALVATDIAARGIDIDDPHRSRRSRWRGHQSGVPGRRRLHAGHRALHQAEHRGQGGGRFWT